MISRLLMLLAGAAAVALTASEKIAPDLPRSGGPVPVIVQYRDAPSFADLQDLAARGSRPTRSLTHIKALAAELPPAQLERLAGSADVSYISPDRPIRSALDTAVAATGADIAPRYGYTGAGIAIAVIDSGIGDHPDFVDPATGRSRVVYRESFAGAPADRYGHGSRVAGVAAGSGAASGGRLHRIAPRASLVDLQALDASGAGTDSSVIAALDRAIELKDVYDIRVINLSVGRPVIESSTLDPICLAVVAAGNHGLEGFPGSEGYWTITSPGNDPYALTVGAMRTMGTSGRGDDLVASYSSKGPSLLDRIVKPDLVAPGNVKLPLSAAVDIGKGSAPYLALCGASIATPAVSGAVALLLEKDPLLTPDQVKARSMSTASKIFPATSVAIDPATRTAYRSQYDIFTIGAGYLDILAALTSVSPPSGTALSTVAPYDPGTGTVLIRAVAGSIWTCFALSAAWGSAVLVPGSAPAAWGSSAVWGSSVSGNTLNRFVEK